MLEIGLYYFQSKISSFSISPLTYNGEDTWLTWMKKKIRNIQKVSHRGFTAFLKLHLPQAKIVALTGPRNHVTFWPCWGLHKTSVYVIGQRPNLTWKWDRCKNVRLGRMVSHIKFHISISNALCAVAKKNVRLVAPTIVNLTWPWPWHSHTISGTLPYVSIELKRPECFSQSL